MCSPETASKADAVSNRRFNVLHPPIFPPWHAGLPLGLTLIKLTKWSCADSRLGPRIFPKTKVALKDNTRLIFTLEAHSVYVLEVAWLKNPKWSQLIHSFLSLNPWGERLLSFMRNKQNFKWTAVTSHLCRLATGKIVWVDRIKCLTQSYCILNWLTSGKLFNVSCLSFHIHEMGNSNRTYIRKLLETLNALTCEKH